MMQGLRDALFGKRRVHQDKDFGRFTARRNGGLLGALADDLIVWESDQPLLIASVPQQSVSVRIYAPVSGPDNVHISALAAIMGSFGRIRDVVKDLMFEDYCLMHDFDPGTYDPQNCDLPKEMIFLTADELLAEVRFTKLEIGNTEWIRQRIMADGDACLWADTGLDHMAWQIFFREGQIADCCNTVA